jgi:hypothetical protein
LGLPVVDLPGPGHGCFGFDNLSTLYAALHRIYERSVSLPDAPLPEFEVRVSNLPKTTEAMRSQDGGGAQYVSVSVGYHAIEPDQKGWYRGW